MSDPKNIVIVTSDYTGEPFAIYQGDARLQVKGCQDVVDDVLRAMGYAIERLSVPHRWIESLERAQGRLFELPDRLDDVRKAAAEPPPPAPEVRQMSVWRSRGSGLRAVVLSTDLSVIRYAFLRPPMFRDSVEAVSIGRFSDMFEPEGGEA